MNQIIAKELDLSRISLPISRLRRDELQLMANHLHKAGIIKQPSIDNLNDWAVQKWLELFESDKYLAIPIVDLELYCTLEDGETLPVDEDDLHDKEISLDYELYNRLSLTLLTFRKAWDPIGSEDGVKYSVVHPLINSENRELPARVIAAVTTIIYEESITVGISTKQTDLPIFRFKAHGKNMLRGSILNRTRLLFLDRYTSSPLMYFLQPRLYVIGDDKVILDPLSSRGMSLEKMREELDTHYLQQNQQSYDFEIQPEYEEPEYDDPGIELS